MAALIGWEMAYIPKRPRGYWDSVENIRSEVDDFTQAHGLLPGTIPQLRDVRAADRYMCTLLRVYVHVLLHVLPYAAGAQRHAHQHM